MRRYIMIQNSILEVKASQTESQAKDLQKALESGTKDIHLPISGEKGWGGTSPSSSS